MVTLHVSVWVEMSSVLTVLTVKSVTLHVSVWVEITSRYYLSHDKWVTLHVSVWVEIGANNRLIHIYLSHAPRERVSWNYCGTGYLLPLLLSRSTWACELKSKKLPSHSTLPPRHAPRERVSWNEIVMTFFAYKFEVTLHVSVWVEIVWRCSFVLSWCKSRSTWACELKYLAPLADVRLLCHAPRERVSWNSWVTMTFVRYVVTLHVSVWVEIDSDCTLIDVVKVTLHVSVWVEIPISLVLLAWNLSRSTWACELKCLRSL